MNAELAHKLLIGGKMLRAAQKTYFRNKTYTNLRTCKDYERRFDELLEECGATKEQPLSLLPRR